MKKYKTGDRKAYDILTKGYLRLVVTIAKKYMHRGLELEDLIQEGTCGLFKAFDHFNANVNVGFSKYASWWIMQSITQALFTLSNTVQLPLNVLTLHRKVWEFVENFEQTHGYPPSIDDIDIDETSDLEWLNYIYQLPANLKEMTCLIGDFDVYESPNSPTDYFQETEYNSYFINRQLRHLGKRNSAILRKYFGLEDNPEGESLNAIGDHFGLTRERARQIVEKSIRELRDLSGIKREEAKIGDLIRLDYSEKVGKVVNIKQVTDGSSVLVLRMDAGNTEEVPASDSSYEILPKRIVKSKPAPSTPTPVIQAKERIQLEQSKKAQEIPDTQREVKNLDGVKVGDILKYNDKECVIRKILCRGSSSRLLIEYTNGVLDYVPNDKSRYRIVHTQVIPQYQVKEERLIENETKRQDGQEASVGDRIVYNTKPCIVLEKSKKYNVIRLKVKYDDGRIDNVLGDHNKYVILSTPQNKNTELMETVKQTRSREMPQSKFLITTSLSSLVGLGILTKKQLKHCHKKGLTTIGDVKKKIEYYRLTPDSSRFTKYTLDMWFHIVGLLNNKV